MLPTDLGLEFSPDLLSKREGDLLPSQGPGSAGTHTYISGRRQPLLKVPGPFLPALSGAQYLFSPFPRKRRQKLLWRLLARF